MGRGAIRGGGVNATSRGGGAACVVFRVSAWLFG